jgi:hypothetical protein
MITVKRIPPYVEVTCEPDDEYEYLKCESNVSGLFLIRCKNGQGNIWIIEGDGNGIWSEESYDLSKMNPAATCEVSKVIETETWMLPSKSQYESAKFN